MPHVAVKCVLLCDSSDAAAHRAEHGGGAQVRRHS
jgi:hypothetical protein